MTRDKITTALDDIQEELARARNLNAADSKLPLAAKLEDMEWKIWELRQSLEY